MWEISVNGQITGFFCSLVLGAALSLLYDIIRSFVKTWFDNSFAVFAGDLLFWIISAIAVFIYLMGATNGEIRGYVLFSAGAGFLFCRSTVGKAVFYLLTRLFSFISFIIGRVIGFCGIPVRFITIRLNTAVKCVFRTVKKLLKSVRCMLYTIKDKKELEYDADEQGR